MSDISVLWALGITELDNPLEELIVDNVSGKYRQIVAGDYNLSLVQNSGMLGQIAEWLAANSGTVSST